VEKLTCPKKAMIKNCSVHEIKENFSKINRAAQTYQNTPK